MREVRYNKTNLKKKNVILKREQHGLPTAWNAVAVMRNATDSKGD